MRLICASGLGDKAPAAFVVETAGRRLLLDLGAGPGGWHPSVDAIGRVDAVLLSHAHVDHAGGLDLLPQLGSPPIYATAAILAGLPPALDRRELPVRGRADVVGIAVETGRTGHALGCVWLALGPLLYMADHSAESAVFAADPPPAVDTIIVDASYGAWDERRDTQAAALLALAATGPLLCPVPADGRGIELALMFAAAGVPVAVDDAVRAALRRIAGRDAVFARPGVAEAAAVLAATAAEADSAGAAAAVRADRAEAGLTEADVAAPGATVAADATADAGTAARLAAGWPGTVAFTGHLATSSAGARLVRAGAAKFVRWNVHPTLAELAGVVAATGARRVVPAFCDPAAYPALAARLAPATLWFGGPLA